MLGLLALTPIGAVGMAARVAAETPVPAFDAPFLSYNGGVEPYRIAAGDLNGDGRADLAVVNEGNVAVLVSQPDGSLARRVRYPKSGVGVAIGDLDGDGHRDVVVCGNGVGVLLGNGDGTLMAPVDHAVGQTFTTCVLADMNHDGHLDVVAMSNPVAILLGDGAGGLGPPTHAPSIPYPLMDHVAVGDFNADGHPDVVIPHGRLHSPAQPCWTEVYGNGSGGFSSTAGGGGTCGIEHPFFIAAANLDGDAQDEIVTAPALAHINAGSWLDKLDVNGNNVTVGLGRGDGTFTFGNGYPAGRYPQDLLAADFDGDGQLDVATVNGGCALSNFMFNCDLLNSVTILHGNPIGTLGQGGKTISHPAILDTELGDLDGDGLADLVTLDGTSVVVELSRGDGTFDPPVARGLGGTPARVALADLNRDGPLDLVIAKGGNAVTLALGQGDGSFGPSQDYAMPVANAVEVVDLDLDADLDVVVVGGSRQGAVRLGDGAGSLGAAIPFANDVGGLMSVAAGDLTGDGIPDLALGGDRVQTMVGNGNGTFQTGITDFSYGTDVALGDLDRDGHLDLVFTNGAFGPAYPDSLVHVRLGRGDGTFDPASLLEVGSWPSNVVIADVDRDTVLDIVTADRSAQTVSVLTGNGDGTFHERVGYGSTGIGVTNHSLGDVNGDGRLDVVMANRTTGSVTLLIQRPDKPRLGVDPSGSSARPGPIELALAQPNPAVHGTSLRFRTQEPGWVRIIVHDVTGRQVARVLDGPRSAGFHEVRWDGLDASGRRVPSGLYVIRASLGGHSSSLKIVAHD